MPPQIVAYDPSGQTNPSAAAAVNRGCPPGYFFQLVGDGFGNTVARCRLMDDAIMANPAQILAQESGPDFYEENMIAFADASAAVVQGAGSLVPILSPVLLVFGVVAAYVMFRR